MSDAQRDQRQSGAHVAGDGARLPMSGRAMVPFAIGALLALSVAPWSTSDHPGMLWAAAVLTGAIITLAALLRWPRQSGWVNVVPPLMYVVVVALLRHGAGGSESGYSPLLLLPVTAMALYGTRAQLLLVLATSAAILAVPIIVQGAPLYPVSEWRRLAILGALGTPTGLAIQSLVARSRELADEAVRARRAVEEQASRFAAVVSGSSDPILTLDPALRITSWNPAATALLGHAEHDALGKDAPELLLSVEDAARIRRGYARVRARHDVARMRLELDARCADGTSVPVEAAVHLDPGATGLAVHVVVREISSRRLADELARGHLDELNELVRVSGVLGALEHAHEVRVLMCSAALRLAGADHALLFEPDPTTGLLTPTAEAGRLRVPNVVLRPERSRSGRVLRTGRPFFDPDLTADAAVDQAAVAAMGVRSAYWQPILRYGLPIGVLVVYWTAARERLPERTTRLLSLLADQTRTAIDRAEHLERMAEQATTDPLTGAANRRGMRGALDRAREHAVATGRPLCVALLDLDHFKAYNDAFGHPAGDEFLRAIAGAWSRLLRPDDTLVRYGGEEFLVVLPDCALGEAVQAADRLRASVPEGRSASAGVAEWNATESLADLLARADSALYQAKADGRDRTVSWAPAE